MSLKVPTRRSCNVWLESRPPANFHLPPAARHIYDPTDIILRLVRILNTQVSEYDLLDGARLQS